MKLNGFLCLVAQGIFIDCAEFKQNEITHREKAYKFNFERYFEAYF